MASTPVRSERYTRVAIAFHWVIAALIVINLGLGIAHDSLPKDWQVMPLHKSIGLTVLALTIGRIVWRLMHPAPPLPGDLKPWERMSAHVSHFLLYAFMLALPLTGWAMSSGPKRRPLEWFGLVDVPYLPVSPAAAGLGHDAHGVLGWAMIALLVLHIGAALRHHFLLRDNVLARMTPGVSTPEAAA